MGTNENKKARNTASQLLNRVIDLTVTEARRALCNGGISDGQLVVAVRVLNEISQNKIYRRDLRITEVLSNAQIYMLARLSNDSTGISTYVPEKHIETN